VLGTKRDRSRGVGCHAQDMLATKCRSLGGLMGLSSVSRLGKPGSDSIAILQGVGDLTAEAVDLQQYSVQAFGCRVRPEGN
jgi:hypothetical protein